MRNVLQRIIRFALCVLGALSILYGLFLTMVTYVTVVTFLHVVIGMPLLLYGLFFTKLNVWMRHGFGKAVKWVFFVGYGVLAVVFAITSVLIIKAQEQPAPKDLQVIVVLGARAYGDVPSWILEQRLYSAHQYLVDNPGTDVIVSGGQGPGESQPEAWTMRNYLLARGIAPERILVEDASADTYENFCNSIEIIEKTYKSRVSAAFVTTDFHIYRAGEIVKKLRYPMAAISAEDKNYLKYGNYFREMLAMVEIWAHNIFEILS